MLGVFAIFAGLLAVTSGQVVNSCTRNPGSLPLTTTVEGCSTPPCVLHNGRPLNIHMTFRATRRLNNMLTIATSYMSLGNFLVPTQINLGSAADTCSNLGNRRCPVNQGDLVNYTLRLNVNEVPLMHIIPFEIRVVDHGPMLCVMIPMRAEPPSVAHEDPVQN